LDLVGGAEAHQLAQIIAGLFGSLFIPLGQPVSLRKQVRENTDIGQNDEQDHPTYLAKARDIVAAKEITADDYEEPKPQDKHEHGEHVGHEIGERETTLKQHDRFSIFLDLRTGCRCVPGPRPPGKNRGSRISLSIEE
jgi:hypothetical protein